MTQSIPPNRLGAGASGNPSGPGSQASPQAPTGLGHSVSIPIADLEALAVRCEKATGPDRELEIEILRFIDPPRVDYMNQQYAKGAAELMGLGGEAWVKRKESLYSHCYTPPRYSASIDAAMTLVPEGWRILTADFSVTGRARWMLQGPIKHYVEPDGYECDAPAYETVFGSTPALALCAVSLRARAASGIEARSDETGTGSAGTARARPDAKLSPFNPTPST